MSQRVVLPLPWIPSSPVRMRLLTGVPAGRSVSNMTTDTDYEVTRRVALMIEEHADNETDGRDPKRVLTDYVENTLDNGWISDHDDTPVWELVELLGHDRDTMDSLAVFAQIAALIEENDFFND